ncbi:chemokine (C-C motif) ligand 38, duplicate 1 isoform X1 [Danio rerio]|uniref:C-C motif chemokine n=1 Tax=Danio rerio TaxID=7955 RepID=A0AB32TC92_DANRE
MRRSCIFIASLVLVAFCSVVGSDWSQCKCCFSFSNARLPVQQVESCHTTNLLCNMNGSQGPEKCCFSFTNARIPLKQIESYYTTHLQCNMNAVIFIIRAQREICTNPTEKWVRRLMKMVDNQNMKQMTEAGSVDSA